MITKRDAWLIGVRFGLEREDCFVGALAFGDKLAKAFDERFPEKKADPLGGLVTTAIDEAKHAFAGMIPPELAAAVSERFDVLANQTLERGDEPYDFAKDE